MNITRQYMDAIDFLKNYWAIIAFIGSVVVQWVMQRGQLTDHQRRIELLENSGSQTSVILADIQVRLASIQTTLEFLTNKKK
jgi:hypothetical protein